MFLSKSKLNSYRILYTPYKQFRNKLNLTEKNFIVERFPSYIKIKIQGEDTLKPKTFLFRTNVKLEDVLIKLGEEYQADFSYTSPHDFLSNNLSEEIKSEEIKSVSEELEKILKEMNLTSSTQREKLISSVFNNQHMDEEAKLRLLYFNLSDEFHQLEQERLKVEKKVNFKINNRLLFLFLLLTSQTILYYHLIWNVEYLGWDLVEPTTFLISSLTFVAGLYFYIKLNRKYNSVDGIVKDLSNNYMKKRYLKMNFNEKKHSDLRRQLDQIKSKLDNNLLKY